MSYLHREGRIGSLTSSLDGVVFYRHTSDQAAPNDAPPQSCFLLESVPFSNPIDPRPCPAPLNEAPAQEKALPFLSLEQVTEAILGLLPADNQRVEMADLYAQCQENLREHARDPLTSFEFFERAITHLGTKVAVYKQWGDDDPVYVSHLPPMPAAPALLSDAVKNCVLSVLTQHTEATFDELHAVCVDFLPHSDLLTPAYVGTTIDELLYSEKIRHCGEGAAYPRIYTLTAPE